MHGDAVGHRLTWTGNDPASLTGREVQVVLRVRDGTVFALSTQ